MPQDDFFYVGKILKTYGNKGQVLVHLDVDDPQQYLDLESVYLDLHGERIPFFIRDLEIKPNNKAVVGFEDFSTMEDAESLKGLEIWLPLSALPPLADDQYYFHEIIGFRVIDQTAGEIGIVAEVMELPHQSLLKVRQASKEILIPIVDEIILEVDKPSKTIRIQAPDGLIDLYLQ